MSNHMEDNSEFLEELARQTDQLRQQELSKMPKQGSLSDRVLPYTYSLHTYKLIN
jgi:hypothetical protein